MNKKLKIFGILLLICILAGLLYYHYKENENDRNSLKVSLAAAISQTYSGDLSIVDFSVLTNFSWDRLYVFGPYTTSKMIDKSLGRFWFGSRFTTIESNDRISLLVFTKNGHVVQYLEFPRWQGDFSTVINKSGYSVEESRFTVDEGWQMIIVDDNSQ